MVKYSSLVFSMAMVGQSNSLRGGESQRILAPPNRVCPFYDKADLKDAIAKYLGGTWNEDCIGAKKNGNTYTAIEAPCSEVYGEMMNDWDVSLITDFSRLFEFASVFNEDIGEWDVGNGKDFDYMFSGAFVFNQDIGNWNVAKGENFQTMFNNARAFDQDLSGWTIQSDALVTVMFASSPMETPCQIDDNLAYFRQANQICEAWDGEGTKKDRVCPTIKNGRCICGGNDFVTCGETCGCP